MMFRSNKKNSRILFIILFLLPALAGQCLFTIYPTLKGMFYSLYQWSGVTSEKRFIGLDNFKQMVTDPYIVGAFKNEFIIIFWKLVLIITISLFFAIAMTRSRLRSTEKSFYRVVFFFPNILSVIIIANIWSFVYHPSIGILNSGLEKLGLGKLACAWLGLPETVIGSIIPVLTWAGIGLYMIIFIAAIKGIPEEIFDSALIDGAGEWRQLFGIILPMIQEQIRFAIVTIIITTFGTSYALIIAMTQGGPNNASQVPGSYIYDQALKQYHAGYAIAIGMVLFVVVMIVTAITNKLLTKEVDA